MKFFDRLKIWGKNKGNKMFQVSEYEKAENQYTKLKERVEELKKTYYTSLGEKKATEEKIAKLENLLSKIDEKIKAKAMENKKADAELLYNKKQQVLTDLKALKATQELQTKVTDKLNSQINTLTKNQTKVKNTLTAIKAKEKYADEVNKYTELLSKASIEGESLDEIEYNVDVKFNAAEFKIEDLNEEGAVDALLEETDSDFEEFYKSLQGQNVENKDKEQ